MKFFYSRNFKDLFPVLSKQTVKYWEGEPHPLCKGMDQFFSGGVLNDNLATFNVTAEGAAPSSWICAGELTERTWL